jgi:catechol 2,3-dioxygenase-like lactoylglutathione lyase family enzyme
MRTLWVPLAVADVAATTEFYKRLGLSQVDSWLHDGEQGAVFAATGSGYVEVIRSAPSSVESETPRLALELPARADVEALGVRLAQAHVVSVAPAQVYPRGHYGFVTADPDGNQILIWSETDR